MNRDELLSLTLGLRLHNPVGSAGQAANDPGRPTWAAAHHPAYRNPGIAQPDHDRADRAM